MNRVQKLRDKAGLTQREMAEKLNCTVTYISHLETGRANATIEKVCDMAEILGFKAVPKVLVYGNNELFEL